MLSLFCGSVVLRCVALSLRCVALALRCLRLRCVADAFYWGLSGPGRVLVFLVNFEIDRTF